MKEIKDYPEYKITENGEVFSVRSNKFLKQEINKRGYKYVRLCTNDKPIHKSIHRLVTETYIPNIDNKPFVNHIDGNQLNNHVSNLEWVTPSENAIHAMKIGLFDFDGENSLSAKLTNRQALEIREEYKKGNISQYKLAKEYNVSRSSIRNVIVGATFSRI